MKNMRVRFTDPSNAGQYWELVWKAERRSGPGPLGRGSPSEYFLIWRWIDRRIDGLPRASMRFDDRFQRAPGILAQVMSKAQQISLGGSSQKEAWRRARAGIVHAEQESVRVMRELGLHVAPHKL
jgi:hypothetical protein